MLRYYSNFFELGPRCFHDDIIPRITPRVFWAVFLHENSCARAFPRSIKLFRSVESERIFSTVSAISRVFSGSNIIAALPATSGKELEFEHATGQPAAIASSGGRPKPS